MPSFYDDPRWKVGGDRIRWSRFGDSVHGRVSGMRFEQIAKDTVAIVELSDVNAVQEGQPCHYEKTELSLSPSHLQRAWDKERPDLGDIVDVQYVEDRNTGQPQPMKMFSFSIQPKLPVQPTPGDIFTR